MNILRKALLRIASGVDKEYHQVIVNEHKKLREQLLHIKYNVVFGGQCPICGSVYEITVDITRALKDEKRPSIPVHCERCKRRPLVNWYSQYHIIQVKRVNKDKK